MYHESGKRGTEQYYKTHETLQSGKTVVFIGPLLPRMGDETVGQATCLLSIIYTEHCIVV